MPGQSEGCKLGRNRGVRDRRTSTIPGHNLFVARKRTESNHERCDRYCKRPHPGWNSLFEKFEVELKKHATTVEVVPDNETFRFGPGAVKKSSRAVIFPVAVGQTVFLLRASLLDEEVPLLISMGVVKQLGKCD